MSGAIRPYRTIREHRKSRLGCFTCKRRRVKCDEGRPVCGSCALRATECKYPDGGGDDDDDNNDEQPREPRRPGAGPALLAAKPARLDTRTAGPVQVLPVRQPAPCLPATSPSDMRMLWFFTANTSTSFVREAAHRGSGSGSGGNGDEDDTFGGTLQTAVVEEALAHPFLMKTLFALASLHMQHLRQDISRTAVMRYRADALQGYRAAVAAADPATFQALLANAVLLEVLPSGEFRDPRAKPLYMLDWMVLWRGIPCIIDLTGTAVTGSAAGPVKNLLKRPPVDRDSAAFVPQALRRMVDGDPAPATTAATAAAAYDRALVCLGSLYDNLRHGFDDTMTRRILTWLTLPPDEFVALARDRDPRALVILCHYAAFLVLLEDAWWLSGVGRRTVRDLCRHLGAQSQWEPLLQVPRRVAETESKTDIVNLLLTAYDTMK